MGRLDKKCPGASWWYQAGGRHPGFLSTHSATLYCAASEDSWGFLAWCLSPSGPGSCHIFSHTLPLLSVPPTLRTAVLFSALGRGAEELCSHCSSCKAQFAPPLSQNSFQGPSPLRRLSRQLPQPLTQHTPPFLPGHWAYLMHCNRLTTFMTSYCGCLLADCLLV